VKPQLPKTDKVTAISDLVPISRTDANEILDILLDTS
jgi:hypothetical protein